MSENPVAEELVKETPDEETLGGNPLESPGRSESRRQAACALAICFATEFLTFKESFCLRQLSKSINFAFRRVGIRTTRFNLEEEKWLLSLSKQQQSFWLSRLCVNESLNVQVDIRNHRGIEPEALCALLFNSRQQIKLLSVEFCMWKPLFNAQDFHASLLRYWESLAAPFTDIYSGFCMPSDEFVKEISKLYSSNNFQQETRVVWDRAMLSLSRSSSFSSKISYGSMQSSQAHGSVIGVPILRSVLPFVDPEVRIYGHKLANSVSLLDEAQNRSSNAFYTQNAYENLEENWTQSWKHYMSSPRGIIFLQLTTLQLKCGVAEYLSLFRDCKFPQLMWLYVEESQLQKYSTHNLKTPTRKQAVDYREHPHRGPSVFHVSSSTHISPFSDVENQKNFLQQPPQQTYNSYGRLQPSNPSFHAPNQTYSIATSLMSSELFGLHYIALAKIIQSTSVLEIADLAIGPREAYKFRNHPIRALAEILYLALIRAGQKTLQRVSCRWVELFMNLVLTFEKGSRPPLTYIHDFDSCVNLTDLPFEFFGEFPTTRTIFTSLRLHDPNDAPRRIFSVYGNSLWSPVSLLDAVSKGHGYGNEKPRQSLGSMSVCLLWLLSVNRLHLHTLVLGAVPREVRRIAQGVCEGKVTHLLNRFPCTCSLRVRVHSCGIARTVFPTSNLIPSLARLNHILPSGSEMWNSKRKRIPNYIQDSLLFVINAHPYASPSDLPSCEPRYAPPEIPASCLVLPRVRTLKFASLQISGNLARRSFLTPEENYYETSTFIRDCKIGPLADLLEFDPGAEPDTIMDIYIHRSWPTSVLEGIDNPIALCGESLINAGERLHNHHVLRITRALKGTVDEVYEAGNAIMKFWWRPKLESITVDLEGTHIRNLASIKKLTPLFGAWYMGSKELRISSNQESCSSHDIKELEEQSSLFLREELSKLSYYRNPTREEQLQLFAINKSLLLAFNYKFPFSRSSQLLPATDPPVQPKPQPTIEENPQLEDFPEVQVTDLTLTVDSAEPDKMSQVSS